MILYNIIFVLVQLYRRNIFASASSRFNSFALIEPCILISCADEEFSQSGWGVQQRF